MNNNNVEKAYQIAREQYASLGIDTDKALKILDTIPLSLHCWQADDLGGFEAEPLSGRGGLHATGNYPGKARNVNEMRKDIEQVLALIPGRHRFFLQASYGDFGTNPPERDQIETKHFTSWVQWAKELEIGLDFMGTFYSHPKADNGFSLSSTDKGIREFWIEHGKRSREICAYMGKELNSRVNNNFWIADGSKDITVNRKLHREILKESLDTIFEKKYDQKYVLDSVEAKLFGIGSESYVVGSHEFYLSYAVARKLMLCIDIGHFHPTENCADKVSAVFEFVNDILFHITRGIRWDSDHVVILNEQLRDLMQEIVWGDYLDRVCLALDFFDASINRIGAYVIGVRAAQKALLLALLDPIKKLREYELNGQWFQRLALFEEMKQKPFGAIYDYYCQTKNVPIGEQYLANVEQYEIKILNNRK
jgi:L-rhamnose isomerase